MRDISRENKKTPEFFSGKTKSTQIYKIFVSKTQKSVGFYANLANRCLQNQDKVQILALGTAIQSAIIVAELLMNSGSASAHHAHVSSVEYKIDKNQKVRKARIEITVVGDRRRHKPDNRRGHANQSPRFSFQGNAEKVKRWQGNLGKMKSWVSVRSPKREISEDHARSKRSCVAVVNQAGNLVKGQSSSRMLGTRGVWQKKLIQPTDLGSRSTSTEQSVTACQQGLPQIPVQSKRFLSFKAFMCHLLSSSVMPKSPNPVVPVKFLKSTKESLGLDSRISDQSKQRCIASLGLDLRSSNQSRQRCIVLSGKRRWGKKQNPKFRVMVSNNIVFGTSGLYKRKEEGVLQDIDGIDIRWKKRRIEMEEWKVVSEGFSMVVPYQPSQSP